jgi:predicted  nucleic acid-binding Zn-ribbon protein
MPGITESLAALHKLQTELQHLEDALARGPRQLQARDRNIKSTEEAVVQLKALQKETRAAADRKSLELRSREQKVTDLRAKLNLASNNREYDILRGQIEADTVASSVLEDEILEVLEKVDGLHRQVVDTEVKVKDLKAERQKFAAEFEASAVGLREQVAKLQGEIKQSEQLFAGDNALRYHRLVEAHGSDALASVGKSSVCSSCFVSLTAQSAVQVRSGLIVFCSTCGRLLYADES